MIIFCLLFFSYVFSFSYRFFYSHHKKKRLLLRKKIQQRNSHVEREKEMRFLFVVNRFKKYKKKIRNNFHIKVTIAQNVKTKKK